MVDGLGQIKALLTAATIALITLLGGCSTTTVRAPEIPPLENHEIYDIPDIDPLRMSPEMEEFVDRHTSHKMGSYEKLMDGKAWSLTYATLDPNLLNFNYDPMLTLPADQAFAEKRGNCLTFSSLFIAMARNAGLTAWYQEVKVPTEWSAVRDTVLVSKHVNAVVQSGSRTYTVDVSRRKPERLEVARKLSDTEAKAQYYNNLGADALIVNDLPRAYAYFRKALETQPGQAFLWSNLGVVFKRNEQPEAALLAYQTALSYDPNEMVALNNTYAMYEEAGNAEAAADIRHRVERNRRKNPYYLLYLAETAKEEHRWSDAIDLLNRAIRMDKQEYRFYYSLAQSQYHAGQMSIAQTNLNRAIELAPPNLEDGPLTLPGDEVY
jgi:tetratricopeptide (TPR) repeat protein